MELLRREEEGLDQGIKLPVVGPTRRTAVNESKIEYVDLNANPIQGCSHACTYCYARKIDLRFGKVKSASEWHKPKYFLNYLEILERELQTGKVDKNREIFLSTMTDLYQPYAIKYGIARKMLELLQEYNCTYRILTKSPAILDDIDILSYEKGKVGLSITTNSGNEVARKKWEPRTHSIADRLATLTELDNYPDVNLWVSAEPFLPGTDFEKYYDEIIDAAGNSLQELMIGKMNYEAGVDVQFDWKKVVEISERYRAEYGNKIRFHYKKEFWNHLAKHKLTPVDLGFATKNEFIWYYQ
jgi:DNA repair photolyase